MKHKEENRKANVESSGGQVASSYLFDTLTADKDGHTINTITTVIKRCGTREPLSIDHWKKELSWAARGYETIIDIASIIKETYKNIFADISTAEIDDALILASVSLIELDPAYNTVSSRLLLKKLFKQVTGASIIDSEVDEVYQSSLVREITTGVSQGLYSKKMLQFDLTRLAQEIKPERDELIGYMGLKTLYERYFARINEKRLELPQTFWMRVAMGLAIEEDDINARAIEFYHLISTVNYVPSTPTLLHSGLVRSQLSSCYLNTVTDDLNHIFKCIGDQAQMSKWSGGVGTDWTNIRATGSYIKSIRVESQGLVPFLKIANDTTAAINRSGKRRSAVSVYLECWHMDVEDFLDLRRNTGDDRRRTHDINTANWIPDLFMKRVLAESNWTLFSPEEVPELHHIYGQAFEQKYVHYEQMAREGKIRKFKVISAVKLWRRMLSRLFETGHPWITFKDACNVRSPQDHAGVIHNSNLCTEITLNTSEDETAVCNLGSVNLAKHVINGQLDTVKLQKTIKTAIRMLDNVIDINFYPTIEGKNSNMRHRPIGLGTMGFQDALYLMNIPFDDERALEFADTTMEHVAYNAFLASSELAKERGAYSSYKGSKWDRGLLPQDTIALLEQERGMSINVNKKENLDWSPVREHIAQWGMRNSNCLAIAPTATISNISGCYPCIEPIYKNIYVKANMTGEFTVINNYLIADLKKHALWNQEMLDKLKYYDGNIAMIDEIPQYIKNKYKEAFELDPEWLIKLTAVRAKWIDQSQSHNVFMKGVSGKKLSDIYIAAWKAGLKTTYYLRTLGATQIEKSTLDAKKFGYTQKREYKNDNGNDTTENKTVRVNVACSILDETDECESCQ